MTNTEKSRCGFKIGKYLLEGTAYKNSLVRIIAEQTGTDGLFDLTIIFFNGYMIDREDITLGDFITEISEVCREADTMEDILKNKCITEYLFWRDNILPVGLAIGRREGLTVMEPEMDN